MVSSETRSVGFCDSISRVGINTPSPQFVVIKNIRFIRMLSFEQVVESFFDDNGLRVCEAAGSIGRET
jgi:hypothetical protein